MSQAEILSPTSALSNSTGRSPGSFSWFAAHEMGLAWRDFIAMMTAGGRYKQRGIIIFLAISAAILHLIAYSVITPLVADGIRPDKPTLVFVACSLAMVFSLMMSQALEMVTRVFYSRSDLDLILSSPVSIARHFTVRVIAVGVTTSCLSALLFGPALNVLAATDSIGWLAGYLALLATGLITTTLSLCITNGLFRLCGAKKTRLISQIIAAIVGASFVIGIQVAAIASFGSISRMSVITSAGFVDAFPDAGSLFWIPVKAIIGDMAALSIYVGVAALTLWLAILAFSKTFGERVLAASNVSATKKQQSSGRTFVGKRSVAGHLRGKEWRLLLRDHWLISQSLMQILYLIPPAFMLYQGFGSAGAASVVVVPVLVMAAGQLSGGLAWLTISGEDAPDLVSTAPVSPGALIRAKVEAVLIAIGVVVAPLILVLAYLDWTLALIASAFIACAAGSATLIQLWFRAQAKRSNFRRRQVSSKIATTAEAFSSILWAGSAGILAAGSWLWVGGVVMNILLLWTVRKFRPDMA